MRLIELEIINVRGIPQILLKPDGKNFVIWGPNGSGKSAVVDAIDFLLTGRISRLMGEGTGGITLSEHGPHIGSKPQDARVRALIQIPGLDRHIRIERCFSNPAVLECPKQERALLEPVLEIARRGQHVLTRREILRFITSNASTRAQQIQDLLNISDVEDIRKALVKVQTEANREFLNARSGVTQAKGLVNATVQQSRYSQEHVIDFINECRGALGGQPLQELNSASLKYGITPPTAHTRNDVPNQTILEKDIQNLLKCLDYAFRDAVSSTDMALREVLTEVRAKGTLLKKFEQVDLVKMGLELLDESGNCPLCDTPWDLNDLRHHLQQKLSNASIASAYQQKIASKANELMETTTSIMSSLQNLIMVSKVVGDAADQASLQKWMYSLDRFSGDLKSVLERYPQVAPDGIDTLFAPPQLNDVLERTLAKVRACYPKATPEQTVWDTLTRLEENIKGLELAENRLKQSELWSLRAKLLNDHFQSARDDVLGGLYNLIRDRFIELYRILHEKDEKDFTAKLEPDGAGLNLEVDFHGRGTYPPHALHSEGHQDSMGLCLYLALSEPLTSGIIDLIILDDVVMSIDAGHRRQLCKMLATEFKDRQFLITTHDRNWAGQLRSEGLVESGGSVEFFNWNVDTGPQVNQEVDLWDRIEADLRREDVPSAAAKLRRGSEEYLAKACDALEAKVQFKLSGRYELGELMQSVMGRYNELLRKAKNSANSWGRVDQMERLLELESISASVFKRTNAEQWAINPNVHYNRWIDFSPSDFATIIDAFHDLFDLLRCCNCKSVVRLISNGTENMAVRCNCGDFNWNLTVRPKA